MNDGLDLGRTYTPIHDEKDDSSVLNYYTEMIHKKRGIDPFIEHIDQLQQATSLNIIFLGNPGTGKSMCATLYGKILHELGFLQNEQYIILSQTNIKDIEHFQEGVCIIDKFDHAYEPIIETMLKTIHNPNNNVVYVLVGYKKEALDMLQSYPKFMSYFPSIINFNDYSIEDMYHILNDWIQEKQLDMTHEFRDLFYEFFSNWYGYRRYNDEHWENVRTLWNEFFLPLYKHSDGLLSKTCIPEELRIFYDSCLIDDR